MSQGQGQAGGSALPTGAIGIIKVSPEDVIKVLEGVDFSPVELGEALDRLGLELTARQRQLLFRAYAVAYEAVVSASPTLLDKLFAPVAVEEQMQLTMMKAVQLIRRAHDDAEQRLRAELVEVIESGMSEDEKRSKIAEVTARLFDLRDTTATALILAPLILLKLVLANLPSTVRPPLANAAMGYDTVGQGQQRRRGIFR